jgi:aspartyl/asparaginyl beta-hydroxylase (cupin superfamily)
MFVDDKISLIDPKIFTDNYGKIREDYIKNRNYDFFIDYSHTYDMTANPDDDFLGFDLTLTEESPWKISPLVFNRKIIGRTPKQCRECFTTNLLLSQPVLPVLAVFSILEPGVELEPHSDGDQRIDENYKDSSVIKYHFSIDIPSDGECGLVVNNEKRILNNADLNMFDEKLSEHYAYNKSDNRRGVLIVSYIRDEVLTY